MKLRFILVLFLLSYLNCGYSQENIVINDLGLQAIMDQVDRKANKLCEYIMNIGSSRSLLSLQEKDIIIRNEVPRLFWEYKQRKMTTSSGANGTIIKTKSMENYFINLLRQSNQPTNREVRYELFYDKVFADENIRNLDSWERLPDRDNCRVWRQTIRFTQAYYIINCDLNRNYDFVVGNRVVKEEVDRKYMYIYLIERKDDLKKLALIGDVYMVERVQ
ncbi:MAG: hypothetical protein IKD24_02775 [Alistipes sp.]|nr:hypothetical protein [Alistipes sp.]